ncbi:hypothetical protein C8Q75DRAFT_504922 [Abortiporus biennis]|nr:hypothetical protein C8Q75DRAFT_504922 [Abortiporus biennis]
MPPKTASSSSRKATTAPSAKSTVTSGTRRSTVTSKGKAVSRKTTTAAPFPPTDPRSKYVMTDRSQFSIEELAQREIKYTRIATEEIAFLSTNPVRRDEAFAALSKNPRVANTLNPDVIVPMDGDLHANEYLGWVDAELQKAPVTFEDHALRLNVAFAGGLIFEEYIKSWGLYCFPNERRAVNRRVTEL